MSGESFRVPPDTFTEGQRWALNLAYEVLTGAGNATADQARRGPEFGGWHPTIDRAHHALGLLLLAARADPGPGQYGVPPPVPLPREVSALDGCDCNGTTDLHTTSCALRELPEEQFRALLAAADRRIAAFRLGVQAAWQAAR